MTNPSFYVHLGAEDGVFVDPHVCFTNDLLAKVHKQDGILAGWCEACQKEYILSL